jgi:hypothetical protein
MGIPPSDGCVFYPKKNQPACQAMTSYEPALLPQSLPSYNIYSCEAPMRFTIRPYRSVLVPYSVSSLSGAFLAQPQAYLLSFCFLFTLLLNPGPVQAEWELVSGDDSAKLTVYVDRETIRRQGNLVKMWQLYDYKTVQTVAGDSLLSIQRHNEYNCTEPRTRMLAYTWFSSNMGRGRVVYKTTVEQKWERIIPRSIDQALWKVACNKQ